MAKVVIVTVSSTSIGTICLYKAMHIIIKILEEYKNQPKSLLRLLLAVANWD